MGHSKSKQAAEVSEAQRASDHLINVVTKRGKLLSMAAAYVVATMTYPQDEDGRRRCILILLTGVSGRAQKRVPRSTDKISRTLGDQISHYGGYAALSDVPAHAEMMQAYRDRSRHGLLAGDVLLNVYRIDNTGMPASVNKAVFLRASQDNDAPVSERKVRHAWSDYRSVAPFWAALRLRQQANSPGGKIPQASPTEILPKRIARVPSGV